MEKELAVLRDTPTEILWLMYESADRVYTLAHTGPGLRRPQSIDLKRSEMLLLLQAALEHLKVDAGLINSVLPKLSKANVVK